jgi:hypothetical protein
MTTFKEIRGTTIEVVSSDPSNPETGQIWYNSSSGTLKGYQLATVNAWASGGSLPAERFASGAAGTKTATVLFSVQNPVGNVNTTLTYNGTSWTTSPGTMNTARSYLGTANSGTQTATLGFGGAATSPTTASESWNGSAWTNTPSLSTARDSGASFGTQTAALFASGIISYGPAVTSPATESWNGSSWTSGNVMNTVRAQGGAAGTQTAGLYFGGTSNGPSGPALTSTESYNGTSWTSLNSLNTARVYPSGSGTQTLALASGGFSITTVGVTELWNGTAWTSNPTGLATTRYMGNNGAGSQTASIFIGGRNGGTYYANTEEWTGQALQVKTVTVS